MVKTREISQSEYLTYHKKSKQAFQAMKLAYDHKLWTPAGREAVFACINITDALLAKYNRLRNISKDHMDVIKIVSSLLPIRDASSQANRLRKIISIKNLVDYESKDFTEKQATEVYKNTERYFSWGETHL